MTAVRERTTAIELDLFIKEHQEKENVLYARYRHSQKIARIGSWEWNIKENNIWWSDELYTLFEVNKETFESSYENYLSLIHPNDRNLVKQQVEDILKDGKPYKHVIRLNLDKNKMKCIKENE